MHYNFKVDKDIKKAETLPSKFYMDESIFELVKKKFFQNLGSGSVMKILLKNQIQFTPLA